MNRAKKAAKNTIWSTVAYVLGMIFGMVSQPIFIQSLGTEYLGISGLFSNVFSMISLVELGIGSSIVYHLYRPIAENKIGQIKSLMQFYKRCYRLVAALVLVISLLVLPFLSYIVGDSTIPHETTVVIYLLFMGEIVCSYLLSYKRSILYATQNNYIIEIIHIVYVISLNLVEILILLLTKNYILYLVIKIVFRIVENVSITVYVNKNYSRFCGKGKPLSRHIVKDIMKKVRGLLYHKIGVFVVAGTDNMIIASFLGVSTVGLYSNYYFIINSLNTAINQVFRSLISGVGNLLVTERREYAFATYRKLSFLNLWFAIMATTGIYVVMERFIGLWVGEEYILPHIVLVVLSIYEFVYLMKITPSIFKEAFGIFYEDRFIPLLESIVNIGMSIFLLHFFGLAGVFMGTICCYLITHFYTYPILVFGKVFKRKYSDYFKIVLPQTILAIICVTTTSFLSNLLYIQNSVLDIVKDILLVFVVPNIVIWLFYRKFDEYKYFKELVLKFLKKLARKMRF